MVLTDTATTLVIANFITMITVVITFLHYDLRQLIKKILQKMLNGQTFRDGVVYAIADNYV